MKGYDFMKFIRLYILLLVLFCLFLYGCAKPATSNSAAPFSSATDISSEVSTPSQAQNSPSSAILQAHSTTSSQAVPMPAVSSAVETIPEAKTVTLIIDGRNSGDKNLNYSYNVKIGTNDTVFLVLKHLYEQKKIELSYQSVPSVYIDAIDGLSQMDAQSGWIYKVNDIFQGKGCDKYEVKKGDVITWIYTRTLGKAEGAPNK